MEYRSEDVMHRPKEVWGGKYLGNGYEVTDEAGLKQSGRRFWKRRGLCGSVGE